MAGEEGF
jgi:hypothetical protein